MNKEEQRKEIDLLEFWRVIVKRKWVVITFTGALIFLVAVFSFLVTPKYESKATLLIEEGTSKFLSIEETFGYQSRIVQDLRFFNTQTNLLQSKSLAERVAKKLNLLSRKEFATQKRGFLGAMRDIIALRWLSPKKESNEDSASALFPPNPYSNIAKIIQMNTKVTPIQDTKLLELSYTSTYPVLSAEIVNTLAEEFIDFSIEKRYERTQQASDFLSTQIAALQEDLAAKEREIQKYIKDKDLFTLSDTESATLNTLDDYYKAYTQARIDRIKAESVYRELKDVNIDSIPQSLSNPIIQQVRGDYTRIKNEYEEKNKQYKPSHPEMIRLKARMDSIKDELKKVVDSTEADYRAALNKESYLKSLLDRQKEDVARISSSAILYNSLKIEVENKRKQLNSLVEKRDGTLVSEKLSGLEANNINIIDKAEVPKKPVSPKRKRNIFLSFLIGILGGVGLCFLLEHLDNRVKGPEDVERLSNLPSLGAVPYLELDSKKSKRFLSDNLGYSYGETNSLEAEDSYAEIKRIELVNHLYPKLSISEDYRTVRTSILLSHAEFPPKTIAFSSALPMEGKTATVVNMAVSFSQLEEKILVIESDLRKPRLHQIFKTRNIAGLSSFLAGKISLEDAVQKTSVKNIWILPSGPIPPNPAELLNSKNMKEMMEEIKKDFEVILLDTPPILAVIDPIIISAISDSTVIVVNPDKLTQKPFLHAVEELRRAKAKIIGVIINGFRVSKGEHNYMEYYRYYPSNYYREVGEQIDRL